MFYLCVTFLTFLYTLFYDTCFLRLTRVRALPQASIYVTRICIVIHATARASFSGSSLQAPSCERLAFSDRPCRIDHVVVDWSC